MLAGCTSSNMNNVYLISLSYTDDTAPASHYDPEQVNPNISSTFASLVSTNPTPGPSWEIRVGYMGFCMPDSTGDWICSRHATSLAKTINETEPRIGDPLNLIWIAKNFQSQIVFVGLMYVAPPDPLTLSLADDASPGSQLYHLVSFLFCFCLPSPAGTKKTTHQAARGK